MPRRRLATPEPFNPTDTRFPGDGGLLDFAKWLYPRWKWVDRIHRPMTEMYERHFYHVQKWRGKRAQGEFQRITLTLMPRGSFKTTLGVQAFTLWAITKDPNIRVAIITKNEDLAKKSLGVVKRTIEGNRDYIERFGRRKPDPKEQDLRLAWASDGIIVADRTDHSLKERTVECMGTTGLDPGFHYDISLFDDPHGDEGIDQYDKAWDRMENFIPVMEPWGVMGVTMTRWDLWDVPARMEANWGKDLAEPIIICRADNGDGVSQIPELYTTDTLATLKRKLGAFKYSAQYILDPVSPEEQRYPQSFYREIQFPRRDLRWVALSIDPAASDAPSGTEHALVVGGWMDGGAFHVLDAESGHWTPDRFSAKVLEKIRLWQPEFLAVERMCWTSWVRANIEIAMRDIRNKPVVEEIPSGRRSKAERCQIWVDDYKAGRMTFSPDITHKEKLKEQMFRFTGGRTTIYGFDLLDALAQLRHVSLGKVPMPSSISIEDRRKNRRRTKLQEMFESWRKGRPEPARGQRSWASF